MPSELEQIQYQEEEPIQKAEVEDVEYTLETAQKELERMGVFKEDYIEKDDLEIDQKLE